MASSLLENTPFAPNKDVLIGWNEKRNSSSLDISRLVPFVNLLAVYDDSINKEFTKSQIDNMNDRLLPLTLDNDTDLKFEGTLRCIPMFNIMSQLNTIKQKGGEGINSLEVTRGTKESFNIRYKMGLTVMDAAVFDSRPEYTSLATLNSMFLVMYGWSGGGGKLFKEAPDVFGSPTVFNSKGININLEATNKGYWRAELMRLYKFDFSFDEQGFVDITAEFMSPHNALMTFIKSIDIQKDVLKLLNDKEADRAAVLQENPDIADIIKSDPKLNNPVINITVETKVPDFSDSPSSEKYIAYAWRQDAEFRTDPKLLWVFSPGHENYKPLSDADIEDLYNLWLKDRRRYTWKDDDKFRSDPSLRFVQGQGATDEEIQVAYEKWSEGNESNEEAGPSDDDKEVNKPDEGS